MAIAWKLSSRDFWAACAVLLSIATASIADDDPQVGIEHTTAEITPDDQAPTSMPEPDVLGRRLNSIQLVEPQANDFSRQVVYLDFDGAERVTYRGPVMITDITVPPFTLEGSPIQGKETVVIDEVYDRLDQLFGEVGIVVVTQEPIEGDYSTVYVGGDGAEFWQFGDFVAVAEKVDAGNNDPNDCAFVFSDRLVVGHTSADALAERIASTTTSVVVRLLGYEMDAAVGGQFGSVAVPQSTFSQQYGGGNVWEEHRLPAGEHRFIVNGILSCKNTRWYVNDVFKETDQSRFLNAYLDPSFRWTFSLGVTKIEADVDDCDTGFEEWHVWNVTVNQPPSRPGTISASNITRTSARVCWGASSDPNGDGITYQVEYKKDFALFWTSAGTTSSTCRNLSNLDSDKWYDVRVRASDGDLNSAWRDQENVFRTLPPNRAPNRPGTLSASNITRTSATVRWGASSDPDGDSVTYEVNYKKDFALFWTSAGSTSSTSRSLSGLEDGTTYDVRVRAFDGSLYSTWRDQENVFTTLANRPPSTPGTISASNITRTSARVCWGVSIDPDGDGITYQVEYKKDFALFWTSAGTTSSTCRNLNNLDSDKWYDVRVRASDGDLNSAWRDQENVFRTLPPNRAPDRPGTISAFNTTRTSTTVSWGASSDPDGDSVTYEVNYKKDHALLWTSGGTTSSTTRILSGLDEGTTYDVRVRAYDGALFSPWRDQENVFTTLSNHAPTTPGSIVVSDPSSDGATICWAASTDTDGDSIHYRLQRKLQVSPLFLTHEETTDTCSRLSELIPCLVYDLRVQAIDSLGAESPWRSSSFSTLCPTSFRGNHFVNKRTAQGVAILLDAKLELDAGFFIPNFDIRNQEVSFEMRMAGQWSRIPEDGVTATRLTTNSNGIASVIFLPPEDMTPDSYPIRAVFASTILLEGTTLERVLTITERTYDAFPEPMQSERTPLVLIHGINSEDKPESMYRWQIFKDQLASFPEVANHLDVIVWRHESNAPVGFNGNTGNAAELADFVYRRNGGLLSKYEPGTKVLLLAHSRGGLVARSFMNYQNQGDDVLGLITLGTPHHGSPLAVPDWVGYTWTRLFGADFQAAFCFNQMVDTEPLECCGYEVVTVGNLNLAWDNLDSKISVSNTFAFDVHIATNGFLNITTNDVNRSGNILDSTLIYTNSYKSQFGTLYDLNIGFAERYKAKIVTFAAYDDLLIDNDLLFGSVLGPLCALVPPLSDDSQVVAEARTTEFLKHQGLRMVQPLMAAMSILPDGSGVYYANDGFAPIQSALFLDTSGGLPFSSNILGFVGIDEENIASRRQVARHHIFNNGDDGIADHLDLLDTDNDSYWSTLAAELGSFVVGDIFVGICPAEVNAPWTLTGPDTQLAGNGELFVTDMSPGDYTIVWGSAPGWEPPSPNPETKLLLAGGTLTFGGVAPDGCYQPSVGDLQVDIDPSAAGLDGACWRLTSEPDTSCHLSGETLYDLPLGGHTILFAGTDCWQPPVPQFVTIEFDQTTFATGIYAGTNCSWLDDTCVIGSCSSALGGCFEEPFNDGGLCDDGVDCTENDRCSNGSCIGTPIPGSDECTVDLDCDDDNLCTDGVCIDTCCTFVDNSDPCDDLDICTVADRCIAGICTGDLLDCFHLDTLCTRGECDGVTGECVSVPDNEGGSCNDGDLCTLLDRCSAGVCSGDPIDCQDGLFCNGVESCLDGICVPGIPIECPDGVNCTTDSCNEGTDSCDNIPKDVLCDNDRYCDGAEWCDQVLDCQVGVRPCALDECCDEETQTCGTGVPCVEDGDCDDGLFCNGAESCTDECCQTGQPPDCDDEIGCTDDSCDEVNNVCVHTPIDDRCPSDLYCDGVIVCDPVQGCITESARCGADQCCLEQCEECRANPTGHGALLYVSSKDADSVTLFDAITGEALAPFVSPGHGGLDSTNGIAISPHTGNLLVASVRTSSIKEYARSADGCESDYLGDFVEGIVASGIAFGPDGKLYVTDFGGDRVLCYDGETGAQDPSYEASGCGLDGPTGLLFTSGGDLLVGSQYTNSVIQFDTDTGSTCSIAANDCGLVTPVGLAFLPNENLLVSSFGTHSVIEFDLSQEDVGDRCVGEFILPGSCDLDGPQGIVLGWNGNVFVASQHTDAVLEFDVDDGSPVAECVFASACGLDGPTYLAFGFGCVTDDDCDDSNACTTDSCADGTCTNALINCSDTDPCTTDSCDPATGCTHARNDPCCGSSNLCCGVDCGDDDLCTTDTCNPVDGSCNNEAVVCPDRQTCDPDTGECVPCITDSDCDDGLFCNGVEQCVDGNCQAGTPPCANDETCDEDNDACLPCNVEIDDGRAVVCHLPQENPDNPQTLIIGEPALNEHLNHGDYEGACNCPCSANDDCPATQACSVNGICGRDTDGDGVPDEEDACINSPAGCSPESDGCCTLSLTLPDPATLPGEDTPVGGPLPLPEFSEVCLFATASSESSPEPGCIIVVPDAGVLTDSFDYWEVNGPGSPIRTNPLMLIMDSDKTVSVHWQDAPCIPGVSPCGVCGRTGICAILMFLGLYALRFVGPGRRTRTRG